MTDSPGIDDAALVTHQNEVRGMCKRSCGHVHQLIRVVAVHPQRHGQPLNAEVKPDQLVKTFITPTDKLFHRNHDDPVHVPQDSSAAQEEWKVSLSVEEEVLDREGAKEWTERWKGAGQDAIMITYGDLLQSTGSCKDVQQLSTTATLECAGNRRQDLAEQGKTEGIQWGTGAISTASWSGPSIRSLLLHNGLPDPFGHHASLDRLLPSESAIMDDAAPWARSLHLHMLSAQPTSESDTPSGEHFGASIPLPTAMHPRQQCILATAQNDQTLTQAHGFPLRAVIPGHVGARWVKWLRGLRISTQAEESPPMRLDYKLIKPPDGASEAEREAWLARMSGEDRDETARKQELNRQEPLQSLGVGSAIEEPAEGARVHGSAVQVRGYAVGQDGSPVVRVEVILLAQRAGETMAALRARAAAAPSGRWTEAQTDARAPDHAGQRDDPTSLSWAWSLWQARIPFFEQVQDAQSYALVARAGR